MEPTKGPNQQKSFYFFWNSVFVLICLAVLPYASYVTLVALGILTLITVFRHPQEVTRVLYRSGWWLIAIAMVLTVVVAQYPGEAALQLANFLPFIVFLGVITMTLPRLVKPFWTIERWSVVLLIASIPITLRAIVEYWLKAPAMVSQLSGLWYFDWLYGQVDYGHRADSVFGHPNVLASYLVMLLGLGLGLTLRHLRCPRVDHTRRWWEQPAWIYVATALLPIGIFCSGSRNGILVAILQLLICGWLMRRNRVILVAETAAISAMVLGVITWGVGGRNVAEAFSTINLRVGVWQLAIDMIRQNPWLGTGLGSYKLLYVPYTVEPYDTVEHAHNLWLMLAAELGVPLMLGITMVVGWSCWRAARSLVNGLFSSPERYLLTGYLLGFMGCSLFALFDLAFYDSRANLLGWLMLAVIQAIPELENRIAANSPDLSDLN